jgi:hypothetical protein
MRSRSSKQDHRAGTFACGWRVRKLPSTSEIVECDGGSRVNTIAEAGSRHADEDVESATINAIYFAAGRCDEPEKRLVI